MPNFKVINGYMFCESISISPYNALIFSIIIFNKNTIKHF
uniref:Uncharacterized protein n=1 Tax=Lepeophtheirus salmonis TaxID=72036 RepID=A0A0K2T6X9_LEPSM